MSHNKCKVEIPNQLPESNLTRVQFKTWKDSMLVYLKLNEEFHHFLPDGMYENWTSADDLKDRIPVLHNDDHLAGAENTADERKKRLAKRQRDLNTMLSIVARKVDQYDYDDVMNLSTSVQFVWNIIELVYDIGRKGVHFLDLANIKYEPGEKPAKFYKKVYHHFMDNLYKKNDALKYKNGTQDKDEKLSPTLLNFMLYHTIQSIDSRLMKKIKDKWGHLLDEDTSLHDLKDIILKAIPDLLSKIDTKEFEANAMTAQLSAFGGGRGKFSGRGQFSGRGRGSQGNTFRQNQFQASGESRKFCRLCQAAKSPKHVYTNHNVSTCNRWSRKDVEDLRVMMCEMQVDPNLYPDSESDQD